jgi:hypothetical protein
LGVERSTTRWALTQAIELPDNRKPWQTPTNWKRKQTELAVHWIRQQVVPEQAELVVLSDTAFDADMIRSACAERHGT